MLIWQYMENSEIIFVLTVESASKQLQHCTPTSLFTKKKLPLPATFVQKVSKVKRG